MGCQTVLAQTQTLLFHTHSKRNMRELSDIQIGGFAYELNDGQLALWSLKHRAYIRSIKQPEHLPSPLLFIQQAGDRVLTLNEKGQLLIWDGLTGNFQDAFRIFNEEQMRIFQEPCYENCPEDRPSLFWANDGQQLAIVVPKQKMQVRDSQTYRFLAQVELPLTELLALSADPKNAYLFFNSGKALVYSLPDLITKPGFELLKFDSHYDETELMGPYLTLMQENSFFSGFKVWDLRNQAQIFSWKYPRLFHNQLIPLNGFLLGLAKSEDQFELILNLETVQFEQNPVERAWPYLIPVLERNWDWVDFAVDSRDFFAVEPQGQLRHWKMKRSLVPQIQFEPESEQRPLTPFNRKISQLENISPWLILTGNDEDIHFIDLKTGKGLYQLHPPAPVTSLALSSSTLALGIAQEKAPQIWLWNRNQKRWKMPLNGHEGWVTDLRFLDSKHLLSAGTDQRLRIWNLFQPNFLSELWLYPEWKTNLSKPIPFLYNLKTNESRPIEWNLKNGTFQTKPEQLEGTPRLAVKEQDVDFSPTKASFSKHPSFWLDFFRMRVMFSQNNQVKLWDLNLHSKPKHLQPCALAQKSKKPCFILGAQAEKDFLWALIDHLPTRKPLPGAGAGGPADDIYAPELVVYDPQSLKELRRISLPEIRVSPYSRFNLTLYRELGKLYFMSDYQQVLEVDLTRGKIGLKQANIPLEKWEIHSSQRCHSWEKTPDRESELFCLKPDPDYGGQIPVYMHFFSGGYLLMVPNGYFIAEGPYQEHVYLSQGNQIVDWATFAKKFHRPEKVKAYFEGQQEYSDVSIKAEAK